MVRRPVALVSLGGALMIKPVPSKENPSAPNKREFTGTDNPRHLRAIAALLRRPMPRENLDTEAGAAMALNWWQSFAAVGLRCHASASTLLTVTVSFAALAFTS